MQQIFFEQFCNVGNPLGHQLLTLYKLDNEFKKNLFRHRQAIRNQLFSGIIYAISETAQFELYIVLQYTTIFHIWFPKFCLEQFARPLHYIVHYIYGCTDIIYIYIYIYILACIVFATLLKASPPFGLALHLIAISRFLLLHVLNTISPSSPPSPHIIFNFFI